MSKPRKVHRFGFARASWSRKIKLSARSETYAHCGVWMRAGSTGTHAVDDHVFTCLPIEAQCRNCRLNEPRAFRDKWSRITEATDDERTMVECLVHAFAAWCQYIDSTGTHADRGCYVRLDDLGQRRCWCGQSSFCWSPLHTLWVHAEGDKILREQLGWKPSNEWRSADGSQAIRVSLIGTMVGPPVMEPTP